MAGEIGYVEESSGTAFRSAEDMSRMAPFVDGVEPRTNRLWKHLRLLFFPW